LEFALAAGIFLKTKNLRKLKLQIELPLLWRQQLPVATVTSSHFDDSPEHSSSTSKAAKHPAYPDGVLKLPKP
jgi:hypothetical protein